MTRSHLMSPFRALNALLLELIATISDRTTESSDHQHSITVSIASFITNSITRVARRRVRALRIPVPLSIRRSIARIHRKNFTHKYHPLQLLPPIDSALRLRTEAHLLLYRSLTIDISRKANGCLECARGLLVDEEEKDEEEEEEVGV